jgi:hypothetical protein
MEATIQQSGPTTGRATGKASLHFSSGDPDNENPGVCSFSNVPMSLHGSSQPVRSNPPYGG